MKRYFKSRVVQVGLATLILGAGPLVGFLIYARLGFYPDPNPNPVALGILAYFTFWPSLALIAFGIWRVRARQDAP